MQLHIRGQKSHVIDCEGSESIAEIREQVAQLESIPVEEVCLYCSGTPLSEDALVASLQSFSIDVSVSLKGGKVHGSLARAGKVKGQTPKVDKQEKKKKKTGRAKRRIQYNRRFVNVVQGFGRRRGPNANS
ncbi:ubiquitin-like FUBI-ribosomal protein eS30 fusion protein [Periplaneta americana]|uniref:ubiquitin-like FUBI-ribosomal protein eS30 fusion protein n=1 Tax=Periplaneta americana TaxID=6978 RepID=UPI0037E96FDD